jgi:hypothetical protein
MPQPDTAYVPPVIGEVVEVYQKSGVATAKIALRMCHIEVPMELLDDPHLGDKILFDADVRLRHVESLYSNGFHTAKEQDIDGES